MLTITTAAGAGVAAAAPGSPLPVPPVPAPPAGVLGPPGPVPALPIPGAPPPPDKDAFYRAPDHLGEHRPGDVLRSRQIIALSATALTGFRTYQLLYRSSDAHGEPIATVATLMLPNVPAPGPRRLVSYHPAEDSLTTRCAPSYTLRTSSGSTQLLESGAIAGLLARGWDVVVPDYEGPESHFTAGRLEGQAALDAVRAAQRYAPSELEGNRTEVGMIGYSGGSIPTTWANALAHEYAPELKLVGVAAGGVPANLRENLPSVDGSPFFSAILLASVGIDRAYPGLDLDRVLNDKGRALAAALSRDAYGCAAGLTVAPYGRISEYTHYRDAADLLAEPRVSRALDRVNLIRGPRFSAPTFLYHEINDEILIIKPVDELVATQCRQGATIQYVRSPIGEHLTGAGAYMGPAMQYLADRFAGRDAPNTCDPT
jgi:hypothetical protein